MFKIAVCDDEREVCTQIEGMLGKLSVQLGTEIDAVTFRRGSALYEAIQNGESFDLILLDIELSEQENGIELCHRLRREKPELRLMPIVIFSGKNNYENQLLQLYPLYFLPKPFGYEKLADILQLALMLGTVANPMFEYQVCGRPRRISLLHILYFEHQSRQIYIRAVDSTRNQ